MAGCFPCDSGFRRNESTLFHDVFAGMMEVASWLSWFHDVLAQLNAQGKRKRSRTRQAQRKSKRGKIMQAQGKGKSGELLQLSFDDKGGNAGFSRGHLPLPQ